LASQRRSIAIPGSDRIDVLSRRTGVMHVAADFEFETACNFQIHIHKIESNRHRFGVRLEAVLQLI